MKKIIVTGLTALFVATSFVNVYAAELKQGGTWYENNGGWSATDTSGIQIFNSWYQDADGSRYFIGSDGMMKDGLVNDNGHYYFLNTSAEGHGKMVTTDGVYHGVNLIFNHDVNSEFFGEILSGADGLMNAGVTQSVVPVSSVNNNTTQPTQSQVQNTKKKSFFDTQTTADGDCHVAGWDEMSPEAQAALINSLQHGGIH